MAMCMSLTAFGISADQKIRILNPQCVQKTYPEYWKDLQALSGANIQF